MDPLVAIGIGVFAGIAFGFSMGMMAGLFVGQARGRSIGLHEAMSRLTAAKKGALDGSCRHP